MIEREFIAQKTKEYYIKKHIESKLDKVGISSIKLKKIPLGEKIIIEESNRSQADDIMNKLMQDPEVLDLIKRKLAS